MPATVTTRTTYTATCPDAHDEHGSGWVGATWKRRADATADMRAHNRLEHPDYNVPEFVHD